MKRYIIRAVGKSKESWQKEAISEYIKRLGAFVKLEIVEIAEGHDGARKVDKKKTQKNEAIALLKSVPKDSFLIALDGTGTNLSSQDFAKRI